MLPDDNGELNHNNDVRNDGNKLSSYKDLSIFNKYRGIDDRQ